MSGTAAVTLRMPSDTKKIGQAFFSSCGLSFNQGMILLLEQAISEGQIVLKPKYNLETIAAMQKSDEILANPQKYKGYTNVQDMFEDILNE